MGGTTEPWYWRWRIRHWPSGQVRGAETRRDEWAALDREANPAAGPMGNCKPGISAGHSMLCPEEEELTHRDDFGRGVALLRPVAAPQTFAICRISRMNRQTFRTDIWWRRAKVIRRAQHAVALRKRKTTARRRDYRSLRWFSVPAISLWIFGRCFASTSTEIRTVPRVTYKGGAWPGA